MVKGLRVHSFFVQQLVISFNYHVHVHVAGFFSAAKLFRTLGENQTLSVK